MSVSGLQRTLYKRKQLLKIEYPNGHRHRKSPRSAAATGCRDRHRRPQTDGRHGQGDLRSGAGLGAVPVLVRIAAALRAGLRHPQRHRGAGDSPGVLVRAGVSGLAGVPLVAAAPRACAGLGAGPRRRLCRCVFDALLSGAGHAPGAADDDGHRGRHHWPGAAARSHAPRRRLADGGAGAAVPGLLHGRALSARRAGAQRRIAQSPALAHVADDGGRVRHRAGCIGQHHLCLCAVRRAARSRGRRQLHDAGELCGAWPHARRAGQGGGGVVGAQRHDFGLVGLQCGVRRHLHHSADEEGGLWGR